MAIIETTAEWRKEEGRKLCQQITADIANRQGWDEVRAEARAIYNGDVSRPDIHFDGATDIHLPVVYENIERLVPKMNNAFWNVWPYVIVDRVPVEYDPEESRIQEHFINWALEHDIEGLYGTTQSWFRNSLIDGNSEVKTRWVTTWRKTCEVHRLKAYKRVQRQIAQEGPDGQIQQIPQKPQMQPRTAFELLDELFGPGQWTPAADMEGTEIQLSIVEDRRPIDGVKVQFRPSERIDEIDALVFRPIVVKDAPEVCVVEADNLIVPFRTRNIQTAKRVTHQHWMYLSEIEEEAMPGRFDSWHLDDEDHEKLSLLSRQGPDREPSSDNKTLTDLRDEVEGGEQSIAPVDTHPIRMFEVYKKYDIDGDGMQEEVVIQIAADIEKILHVTYLDTLHPHGRRPFAGMRYQTDSDRYYVPGLAARLAGLNIQANITLNQINDRQTLVSNPFGFYRPMALPQDPDAVKRIKPGEMIPTPDPGGIVFPSWGTSPLADMSLFDIPLMFADRVGVPPQMGGSNQSQNAPRTARGTLALLSEGNLKVDNIISLAQKEGFQELMHQLFGLYSTYMSDEKHFWATGKDRVKRPAMIGRRMMRGRFEFRFRGNTVNTNPEVQRTLAQIRYQVASTNPMYMQDPVKFRELLRDFLENHSDGTSVERILPDLPGGGAEPHPPMDQKMEIQAIRLHRPLEALQTDNHLQHMQQIDQFTQSTAFESMDDVAIGLLAQHYIQHQQMFQRQRQMMAVQQQATGMGGAGGDDGGGAAANGGAQGIGLSELQGGIE